MRILPADIIEALRRGPRPEWRESGPERGQDYYQPGESDSEFNSRIVQMLRKHLDLNQPVQKRGQDEKQGLGRLA
jgi:hypothetical protein